MKAYLRLICCLGMFICMILITNNLIAQIQINKENSGVNVIPDSNQFYFKRIPNTFLDSVTDLNKLSYISKKQYLAWLKPFFLRDSIPYAIDRYCPWFKLLSYQNKRENYYSVLVLLNEDIPETYLLTIDNRGFFIDAMTVDYTHNLSNSDIYLDKSDSSYVYSTWVNSFFKGDTIRKVEILDKSFNPDGHEEYEFWQEIFETLFVINHDGYITCLKPKTLISE